MFLLTIWLVGKESGPRSTDAIQQSFARPKPFPPLPHQSDAVEAIVQGLSKDSRGTAAKACGTGKTLTALWTFERLDPAVTVVVVPSLNLLKQTLEEWSRHSSLEWRFLCVCSDESVLPADDTPVGRTSELGVPVTTDVTEIRAFLQRPTRKVIFSTYQSSERIGEALISEAQKADLVICDEAHRLVGKIDAANSSVLSDVRFPIEKRLFLTATPRVFDASVKRSLAARGLDSASMDDTELFGRRLYSLPFGAAIEKGLLTDYQIAFIGVTRAEIAELATAKVNVERTAGNHSDLSMLVAEVATLKAIRKFGLSTLISFHSTVKRARYFSDELHVTAKALGQGSAEGAAEIWATHVDGGMPTGTRAARLRLLRDGTPERPILVSNARCLTEGVDVPTLDGVVFADPKRSKTDIASRRESD